MRTRLPIRGVLAGLLVLAIGFYIPAFAADGPAAPAEGEPLTFRFTPLQGEPIEGRLLTPVFRLRTEFGTQEIEARHVRQVAFHPAAEPTTPDTLQLSDKSRVHGTLINDSFRLATTEGERVFSAAELREITAQKKQLNVWAIILGLVMLTVMEIVLGIDNVIFLAIIASKLPPEEQPRARRIGLLAALGMRLLLLFSVFWLMGLTRPLFTLPEMPFLDTIEARGISGRDLVLLLGGLFLLYKSVNEIHHKLEGQDHAAGGAGTARRASFASVIFQIAVIDIIFSLDSVITAVGMVDEVWVMAVAMVVAIAVMMAFAGAISDYVARHPTIKMLALAFLILIAVMLIAEGFGQHIDKGYIYFAMAFSVLVEMLNLRLRRTPEPVTLHRSRMPGRHE